MIYVEIVTRKISWLTMAMRISIHMHVVWTINRAFPRTERIMISCLTQLIALNETNNGDAEKGISLRNATACGV